VTVVTVKLLSVKGVTEGIMVVLASRDACNERSDTFSDTTTTALKSTANTPNTFTPAALTISTKKISLNNHWKRREKI